MKTQEELISTVAKNLISYRKKCGLTQLQLAERISYSDKAISKWERGEALPDVFILSKIAEIFNVTVNDLISDSSSTKALEIETIKKTKVINRNRTVIGLLSYILAWFVFVIAYVIFEMIGVNFESWLLFIYAIPTSAIVLLVFAKMWGVRWMRSIIISVLNWGLSLSTHLSIVALTNIPNSYLLYLISASFQVLILFWYLRRKDND